MKNFLFFSLFLSCFLLVSCGGGRYTTGPAYSYDSPDPIVVDDDESYGLASLDRNVIMNGTLSLAVNDADSTIDAMVELALQYDGYIVSANRDQTTMRVLAANFKDAMEAIKSNGDLIDQQITGQDISDTFYDLESRLTSAEKAHARYFELLQLATNSDEILRIEREIERLNQTIDSIQGQLKRLDHLESYATITVTYTEKEKRVKPGVLSYVGIGVYKGVKWLFVRN